MTPPAVAWNWSRGDAHRGASRPLRRSTETAPLHRSTADITTAFDVTGATAVADAMTRCADPATCGSEFEADGFASRTVTCSRCGLAGVLDHDLVGDPDAAEARS